MNLIEVCFSGSSTRFPIFIGALKALQKYKIVSLSASSGGSLVGGLYSCGIGWKELEELCLKIDFSDYIGCDILGLAKRLVFGNKLRDLLIYITKHKKIKDADCNLYIVATDINKRSKFIFSKEETPNEYIADAICASIAIPVLLPPMHGLVDGAISSSFPIDYLSGRHPRLGVRVGSKMIPGLGLKNIANLLISAYNVYGSERAISKSDKENLKIVEIEDKDSFFDFDISTNKKKQMISKGYKATKEALGVSSRENISYSR